MPDFETKIGNLTLTYATQIHACVVEIDPETGTSSSSTTRPWTTAASASTRRSSRARCTARPSTGSAPALHETFAYDEYGQLLTANFYDYHVPHALDLPEIKTGHIESPSPFSSLGTKGMGEGGGAAIHAICAAIQDALRNAAKAIVTDSHNPPERVWRMLNDPDETAALVEVSE